MSRRKKKGHQSKQERKQQAKQETVKLDKTSVNPQTQTNATQGTTATKTVVSRPPLPPIEQREKTQIMVASLPWPEAELAPWEEKELEDFLGIYDTLNKSTDKGTTTATK